MITVNNSTRLVVVLKNDEFVGKIVRNQGKIFEEDTLKIMLDYIRPGTTVVEAGGWHARLQAGLPGCVAGWSGAGYLAAAERGAAAGAQAWCTSANSGRLLAHPACMCFQDRHACHWD
jgi:hypothetical protein